MQSRITVLEGRQLYTRRNIPIPCPLRTRVEKETTKSDEEEALITTEPKALLEVRDQAERNALD